MALNLNSLISDRPTLNNQNSINREQDKTDARDDTDYLIKELSIDGGDQWFKSGGETWRLLFSADEQCLAWSAGSQIMLVPRENYSNKNAPNTGRTINCGDPIRSLLFLSIKDVHSYSTAFWIKSAGCKQMFLAAGHNNGKIRIFDLEGKLLLQLNGHSSIVTDLATNVDNNLLISSSHDGTIKIRNLLRNEGELVKTLSLGQQIETVKVSPNGQYLAAGGSNGIIYVWRMSDYELIDKFRGHRHRISSIAWSPDSYRLASVSYDSTCMLWSVLNGQKIAQYNHLNPEPSSIFASGDNGHHGRSVCFAPDNHHLLTISDDNYCDRKVAVWDIEQSDKPIKSFKISDALSCKYSPSGSMLAIGTKNGNVTILKNIKSVKSLLSLCRTEIRRHDLYQEPEDNERRILPEQLVSYLNYE